MPGGGAVEFVECHQERPAELSRPGARYVSTSSPPSDCLFSISFSSFYVSLFPLRFLGALPSSPAGGSTCRASSVTSPSPPYLISLILSPSGVWPPLAVLWSLPLRGLALPPPPRPGVYFVSLSALVLTTRIHSGSPGPRPRPLHHSDKYPLCSVLCLAL